MAPSMAPTTSYSPRLMFTTPTKTPITIITGTAKATHFKFSMHIQSRSEQKHIKTVWQKYP